LAANNGQIPAEERYRNGTPVITYPTIVTLAIVNAALSQALIGENYQHAFKAINGKAPYAWSLANGTLPDGLTLDAGGNFAGTVTGAKGNYAFTIIVQDGEGESDSARVSLNVISPEDVNLANGLTHLANSENFNANNPVTGLWDGDVSGNPVNSPGNENTSSLWVEFDLGQLYQINTVRLFGDAQGTWASTAYTVEIKVGVNDAYVKIVDNADCAGDQWYETAHTEDVRFIKLTVLGNQTANATQVREFEAYGTLNPGVVTNGVLGFSNSDLVLRHYPNPFTSSARISFQMRKNLKKGELRIFDVAGKLVRKYPLQGKSGQIIWAGENKNNQPVPNGVYWYQLTNGRQSVSKRLLLAR